MKQQTTKRLRRSNLSDARVWHQMQGDPCPCPTSLEDLQPETRAEYIGGAHRDALSRWAVRLAKCHREISAVGLIRGIISNRTFLTLHRRAMEWGIRARTGADSISECDLRRLVGDLCGEVRRHAESCGITRRQDMHPQVSGWENRVWLAVNHGTYSVQSAAETLCCSTDDIHRYLESLGLGKQNLKSLRS